MKIAVVSDIHNNTSNLSCVSEEIIKNDCKMLFALGDYTTLATFKRLAKTNIPMYAVFGNADKNQEKTERWARQADKQITLRREMNRVKLEERNLALTHSPEIAEKLLKSGMYDAVFYGHTHKPEKKFDEETLVANPGAVKRGNFGLYDSKKNKFKIIKI